MKQCGTCKEYHSSKEFTSSKYRCKSCDRKRKKKERVLRSHSQVDRKHWLKREYRLTPDDYEKLLNLCEQKCEICGISQTELNYHLCVDHNHSTGEIRGLLCKRCNSAIGQFDDKLETIQKAYEYLKRKK